MLVIFRVEGLELRTEPAELAEPADRMLEPATRSRLSSTSAYVAPSGSCMSRVSPPSYSTPAIVLTNCPPALMMTFTCATEHAPQSDSRPQAAAGCPALRFSVPNA